MSFSCHHGILKKNTINFMSNILKKCSIFIQGITVFKIFIWGGTPEPLYNTVHYNTVLDITRIKVGSQMAILDTFFCMTCAFYSQYNMVWIANTEIGLNSNSSVIKRLWCISSVLWSEILISGDA